MAKAVKKHEPPQDKFQAMLDGFAVFSENFAGEDWQYDPKTFGFTFLEIFPYSARTIATLKQHSGSDIENALLLKGEIHLLALPSPESQGETDFEASLALLRHSEKASKIKTRKNKPRLLMVTDGVEYYGEDTKNGVPFSGELKDLNSGEAYSPFLPLIKIDYVAEIKETALDRKAAAILRRLYIELLKANPEWSKDEKRPALNFFLARLIFCLFADKTGIFRENSFRRVVELHGARGAGKFSEIHQTILEYFTALGLKEGERQNLPNWAQKLRYVNGHLFEHHVEVPKFSASAWRYLMAAAKEKWKEINPDIFGSLIQTIKAGTQEGAEERGEDGIHYTSVSNILKLLNPLFLDGLREEIDEACDYGPKLKASKLNALLTRIKKIRVFDPACGSGNFLVIAYKELRKLEHDIKEKLGKTGDLLAESEITLRNFRGIEKEDFPTQIARLSLVVAKFQCDVVYKGLGKAQEEALPLDKENWIVEGNALRLDWHKVCPVHETEVKVEKAENALNFMSEPQAAIDFEHEGGELYIVGNPPYRGSTYQTKEQKADLDEVFKNKAKKYASLDYISCWFFKASEIISYSTVQYSTVQYSTVQYNTIQYNTTPLLSLLSVRPLLRRTHFAKGRRLAHYGRY
ncbi:class I SAM-dependent DNA methyltransferase [Acetobacteraceae bacterium]|nr:class I SAM-dependent DNA methyltransferase [Acetobacteraceae bacterium]